ncbi:MAG: hypothetical protein AABX07_05505 [Nanoarchaeota archaeon]
MNLEEINEYFFVRAVPQGGKAMYQVLCRGPEKIGIINADVNPQVLGIALGKWMLNVTNAKQTKHFNFALSYTPPTNHFFIVQNGQMSFYDIEETNPSERKLFRSGLLTAIEESQKHSLE